MAMPWCAATRCPNQTDCQGYINTNAGNVELLSQVACCKVLCGRGRDMGILALRCGGTSVLSAYFIVIYVWFLYLAAVGLLGTGLLIKFKRWFFWISAFGTAIFQTAVTGIYVTYVTSSVTYLDALVPAVGAMNIAVFSFFFSGFQYSIGVTYEAGPLIALFAAAIPIFKAILKTPGEYAFLRDANRLALAMLILAFIWVIHSVSFRILGYRVQWRLFDAPRRRGPDERVNVCYLLGAGQGHPTWRTPVGQTTCSLLMMFSWAILKAIWNDLKNKRKCRPDWILGMMIWVPPLLMTLAFLYNFVSALRGQRIVCDFVVENRRQPTGIWDDLKSLWKRLIRKGPPESPSPSPHKGSHPGRHIYERFGFYLAESPWEYVKVVALHKRGRNTYTIETVPDSVLGKTDKCIGYLAWVLALVGLILGAPMTGILNLVAFLLGKALKLLGGSRDESDDKGWLQRFFTWLVTTTVSKEHVKSANKVLIESYVEKDLSDDPLDNPLDTLNLSETARIGRYINLPYLLDNISHEELHVLLNRPN